MLSYLFLLAAASSSVETSSFVKTSADATADRASISELPTTDLAPTENLFAFAEVITDDDFQELVAKMAQTDEDHATMTVAHLEIEQDDHIAVAALPITIINNIDPKMLEYKHWTGKYSPETFSISVNGTMLDQGKTCEIPANTATVEIGYNYSFMKGIKTGGRRIAYQLDENITQLNITFNWKDDWRVIVDKGKAVKEVNA